MNTTLKVEKLPAFKNFSLEDLPGEVWKEIPGLDFRYAVSNKGRVKSLTKISSGPFGRKREWPEKILKQQLNDTGYLYLNLKIGGKSKKHFIARVVAEQFIDNNNDYPEVNHIDEIKTNNTVENLMWCTREQNMNHNGLMNRLTKKFRDSFKRKTYQYTSSLILVNTWEAIIDAQEDGFTPQAISRCCYGRQKTHAGYIWSFQPLHEITKP